MQCPQHNTARGVHPCGISIRTISDMQQLLPINARGIHPYGISIETSGDM